MTRVKISLGFASVFAAVVALGHFQVLVPSSEFAGVDSKTVDLEIVFTHPMSNGPVMDMGKPSEFGVLVNGVKTDLTSVLRKREVSGKSAYTASYKVKRPGDHVFYIAPAPYWEPAEEKMIIHYTKVVVDAFGGEDGWDAMVGFPVEIKPLVRPYGLWTGNVFRGIVMRDGKAVPYAEIEVEYLNKEGKVAIPEDAFETQVIKSDANGVFCYAMPREGWWAFAALLDGGKMENPRGKEVDVELGGLMWVRCRNMEEK